MIFPGVFDTGNVEYLFAFCRFDLCRRGEAIVNDRDFFFGNVPVFYQIVPGGFAYGNDTLHFSDIMRQDPFDVEHPEPVIFYRHMILREIVNHRNRKYRITA